MKAQVGVPHIASHGGQHYEYRDVKDQTVKNHGRTLLNLCHSNAAVVANHLYYTGCQLGCDLSFKRRQTWISEIHLCTTKSECIDLIKDVTARQDAEGSDHVRLCVTLTVDSCRTVSQFQLLSSLGQSHQSVSVQQKLQRLLL